MNYKCAGVLGLSVFMLFGVLTTNTMYSDFAGLLAYAFIFAGIPYTFYKTFPSKAGLLIAIALPIALGMSWGRWVDFLIQQKLNREGITTTGIVIAAWESRTRNGGKEKLYNASFGSPSGDIQTSTYENIKDLRKGDTVTVRYAFSNPRIYKIEGLDD